MTVAALRLAPRLLPGGACATLALLAGCLISALAWAGPADAGARGARAPEAVRAGGDPARYDVADWLRRMHQAARQTTYVGTFVVSSPGGSLSSARISHACEPQLQVQRVEALSGPQRITFRRGDQMMTYLPQSRQVRSEQRDSLGVFPNLLGGTEATIAQWYEARLLGAGRVAGIDADVVQLVPRDALRYGYRVWSERETGLVMQLQTLDASGTVVEQWAFSELQLHAPVKAQALARAMNDVRGYEVEKSTLERTTPEREGWRLRSPVDGFTAVSCYRRPRGNEAGTAAASLLQWTFSDGLSIVSLFVEPDDPQRPRREAVTALGSTHTLTRRLSQADGDWWLTAVGEVPPQTLDAFARNLMRGSP